MVSSVAGVRGTHFDMGRVVERTFGALRRNFVPFFLLSLVLTGLPTFAFGLVQAQFVSQTGSGPILTSLALTVVGWLLKTLTSFLLKGLLVYATVVDLNGGKASVSESIAASGRVLLSLVAIGLLQGLALGLGTLLLIVPAAIIASMWAVTAPAAVMERTGIAGAFDRSARLTRGVRWPIFGLLVAYTVTSWLLQLGGLVVVGAFTRVSPGQPTGISAEVVSAVVSTVMALISSVGVAAIYYELRSAREGIGPQQIAAIFD